MTTPLVTVLITTYNYGQFVEQAIDSVLSQDFPSEKVQIVIVDDGSIDDTADRVKKYGSRIEYFYKPNGGQASALNFGISKSLGEIVALLDADDLFLPNKLGRVAEAFQKDPAIGMVYHPLREWHIQSNERRDSNFRLISGDVWKAPDQFLSYVIHPASCISFRRTSLSRLIPIPEQILMLADAYWVTLIPFLAPILALPEPLVVYRVHGGNSYYADETQHLLEVRKNRLPKWQIVIDAMRKWLADNDYGDHQPAVRSFLARWSLVSQEGRFEIQPPGRLRFFFFLLRQNYTYRDLQTRKFTAFNYFYALSALILGYSRAGQYYKTRGMVMGAMQRTMNTFLRTRHNS
jgi:glycosyltransferase involved in cell wall biosynthesis